MYRRCVYVTIRACLSHRQTMMITRACQKVEACARSHTRARNLFFENFHERKLRFVKWYICICEFRIQFVRGFCMSRCVGRSLGLARRRALKNYFDVGLAQNHTSTTASQVAWKLPDLILEKILLASNFHFLFYKIHYFIIFTFFLFSSSICFFRFLLGFICYLGFFQHSFVI